VSLWAITLAGFCWGFGIVLPQGARGINQRLPEILEDAENGLPGEVRVLLKTVKASYDQLETQIEQLTQAIAVWHRENAVSQCLETIPGIGVLTVILLATCDRNRVGGK
jgi:transposase